MRFSDCKTSTNKRLRPLQISVRKEKLTEQMGRWGLLHGRRKLGRGPHGTLNVRHEEPLKGNLCRSGRRRSHCTNDDWPRSKHDTWKQTASGTKACQEKTCWLNVTRGLTGDNSASFLTALESTQRGPRHIEASCGVTNSRVVVGSCFALKETGSNIAVQQS